MGPHVLTADGRFYSQGTGGLLRAWTKFARGCRAIADGIPYDVAWRLYVDHFEPWADAEHEEAATVARDAGADA